MKKRWIVTTMAALAAVTLFSGCEARVQIKSEPGTSEVARVCEGCPPAWFTGKTSLYVVDQSGQLYQLRQMWSNANAYAVYQVMGETNGFYH